MSEKTPDAGLAYLGPHYEKLIDCIVTWLAIKAQNAQPGWNHAPSHADFSKSRLFWRLRTGQRPLPEPPPTAFSCPWYEVVEIPGPHDCFEVWFDGDKAIINQCGYEITHLSAPLHKQGAVNRVKFGSIEYALWRDVEKRISKMIFDPGDNEPLKKSLREQESFGWYIEKIIKK